MQSIGERTMKMQTILSIACCGGLLLSINSLAEVNNKHLLPAQNPYSNRSPFRYVIVNNEVIVWKDSKYPGRYRTHRSRSGRRADRDHCQTDRRARPQAVGTIAAHPKWTPGRATAARSRSPRSPIPTTIWNASACISSPRRATPTVCLSPGR